MQHDENFESELLDQLADIIEDNIIKDSKVINIGTVLVPSEKSNTKKIKISIVEPKGFIPQNEKDVEGLEPLFESEK